MPTLSTQGQSRGGLSAKDWHEQFLAKADRDQIVQHRAAGDENAVTRIAVTLARQCILFAHFQRLWMLRIAGMEETLGTDTYMRTVYFGRNSLYKELSRQKDG